MSDARAAILDGIRAALGRGPTEAPPFRRAAVRPAFDGDLLERFCHKLEARAATTERLATMAQLPVAVLAYVRQHALPPSIDVAPALADLAWPAALDRRSGRAPIDSVTSVTPCLAGVAESGSVMLVSHPSTPTTLNFVPEHHLVVVRAAQVVKHHEEAWVRLRDFISEHGAVPRVVNFVSGPSRTADIEQTIQLGAHGPRRLHVLLVAES
jgi:L-lactate dehydrogenase complex protein LldG